MMIDLSAGFVVSRADSFCETSKDEWVGGRA